MLVSRDRLRKQHVHSSSPCHTLHSLCRLLPLFNHVWTSNLVFVLSPHLSPHHFLVALAALDVHLGLHPGGADHWNSHLAFCKELRLWNATVESVGSLRGQSVCHSLSPGLVQKEGWDWIENIYITWYNVIYIYIYMYWLYTWDWSIPAGQSISAVCHRHANSILVPRVAGLLYPKSWDQAGFFPQTWGWGAAPNQGSSTHRDTLFWLAVF